MHNRFLQYDILDYFTDKEDYVTIQEIAEEFDLTKSQVHGIMARINKYDRIERKQFRIKNTKKSQYRYKRKPLKEHKKLIANMYGRSLKRR